jgi:GNAT superfamily N-acetyltransferase
MEEDTSMSGVEIGWYTGERLRLRNLFALAEDSSQRLEASIDLGRVLVATDDGQIIALLQLVESDTADEVELRSMAVVDHRQRQGLGRALVARAIARAALRACARCSSRPHRPTPATCASTSGWDFGCFASTVTRSRRPTATPTDSPLKESRCAIASG